MKSIKYNFLWEEKKDEIKTEDVESRGYKKAVKSFQNKYPNIKRTWISWV